MTTEINLRDHQSCNGLKIRLTRLIEARLIKYA